jgi:hypothetical protein
MNLTATTDKIELVLGAAHTTNALPCSVLWSDIVNSTGAATAGRTMTTSNGTTAVDISGSPASGSSRLITSVSIVNSDTVAQTVTVRFDANGTETNMIKAQLGVDERLEFSKGTGWRVFTAKGSVKNTFDETIPASYEWVDAVLASDVTNNNATANTLQNITGLSHSVTAGNKYWFELFGVYTAAATTTGSRWTISAPAVTYLGYYSQYTLTATTMTTNFASAIQLPAASNASSLTTGNVVYLSGIIQPSANGTLQAQFASEVSASAIVAKAGMIFRIRQVA